VFRRVEGVDTRSAGTARSARRQLSIADIRWADIILVMEDKHAARIRADFRNETRYKPHGRGVGRAYPGKGATADL
jgi:predicted protein tyrosine phosphatase